MYLFNFSSCFKMFFLTRSPLYLFTSYPMEGGGSFKCSFSTRADCTFSPLPVEEGGFQMFFLNPGRLYLLTSACGGGGISNVLFKPGQIVSSHLCDRGFSLLQMFLLTRADLCFLTSATGVSPWGGGGGGFTGLSPLWLHNVFLSFYIITIM